MLTSSWSAERHRSSMTISPLLTSAERRERSRSGSPRPAATRNGSAALPLCHWLEVFVVPPDLPFLLNASKEVMRHDAAPEARLALALHTATRFSKHLVAMAYDPLPRSQGHVEL